MVMVTVTWPRAELREWMKSRYERIVSVEGNPMILCGSFVLDMARGYTPIGILLSYMEHPFYGYENGVVAKLFPDLVGDLIDCRVLTLTGEIHPYASARLVAVTEPDE